MHARVEVRVAPGEVVVVMMACEVVARWLRGGARRCKGVQRTAWGRLRSRAARPAWRHGPWRRRCAARCAPRGLAGWGRTPPAVGAAPSQARPCTRSSSAPSGRSNRATRRTGAEIAARAAAAWGAEGAAGATVQRGRRGQRVGRGRRVRRVQRVQREAGAASATVQQKCSRGCGGRGGCRP
eukprot:scaffold27654_cov58-Phaeocystis_antarctica.AAC.5